MSTTKTVRTRFAPSPTGTLHIGGVRTALFSWLYARHTGGQFLLRIEDTDRERSTLESVEQIKTTLKAYGLDWDEGPDVGGPCGPYTQSERLHIYRAHAQRLLDQGHLYKCWCSKHRLEELSKAKQEGKITLGYDRHCRHLTAAQKAAFENSDAPYTLRLAAPLDGETAYEDIVRGPSSVQNCTVTDQIMFKSDGFPTYHLASVIDDHEMGITHVLRGEEWISSTPLHVLLYKCFNWEPPKFGHLASVLKIDSDGKKKKLSKRDGDGSAVGYLEKGYLATAVLNQLLLTGWSPSDNTEIMSESERVERFDLSRLVASPAVLDIAKLTHFNGEYLKKLSADHFMQWLIPHLVKCALLSPSPTTAELAAVSRIAPMLQTRIGRFDDEAESYVRPFFVAPAPGKEKLQVKGCPDETVLDALASARTLLLQVAPFTASAIEPALKQLETEKGLKKKLLLAVRKAVSGCEVSLPLFESLSILGRTETLARLDQACTILAESVT